MPTAVIEPKMQTRRAAPAGGRAVLRRICTMLSLVGWAAVSLLSGASLPVMLGFAAACFFVFVAAGLCTGGLVGTQRQQYPADGGGIRLCFTGWNPLRGRAAGLSLAAPAVAAAAGCGMAFPAKAAGTAAFALRRTNTAAHVG